MPGEWFREVEFGTVLRPSAANLSRSGGKMRLAFVCSQPAGEYIGDFWGVVVVSDERVEPDQLWSGRYSNWEVDTEWQRQDPAT